MTDSGNMNVKHDDNSSKADSLSPDTVKKSTLILCIFISIIGTFAALEMNGLIKHNEQKDDYPIAEYKAIFIEKTDEKSYRLSHKPSNQTASCQSGYLFISSDKNADMQGLLVDYKNRGVKCTRLESNPAPSNAQ